MFLIIYLVGDDSDLILFHSLALDLCFTVTKFSAPDPYAEVKCMTKSGMECPGLCHLFRIV